MIKPTKYAWQASVTQVLRAEAMMAENAKQMEAKGFRRVAGTPDVWEYRGTRDEAQAIIEEVWGPGKVKSWHRPTGKAYKPSVGLEAIIWDGWSRGFYPMQTLQEARAMGFVVSLEWIQAHWERMTREMYEFEAKLRSGPEDAGIGGGRETRTT